MIVVHSFGRHCFAPIRHQPELQRPPGWARQGCCRYPLSLLSPLAHPHRWASWPPRRPLHWYWPHRTKLRSAYQQPQEFRSIVGRPHPWWWGRQLLLPPSPRTQPLLHRQHRRTCSSRHRHRPCRRRQPRAAAFGDTPAGSSDGRSAPRGDLPCAAAASASGAAVPADRTLRRRRRRSTRLRCRLPRPR